MDSNTMKLTLVPELTAAEAEAAVEETHRRRTWLGLPTREEKRHRIHDFVARLKRDLKASQDLNEELGGMLKDALEKNVDLTEQVAKLTEQLRVAEDANRANTTGVDFRFAERRVDGPEDQATMPIAQAILINDTGLDEAEQRIVAANAAAALLDRVVPKTVPAIESPVETKAMPVVQPLIRPLIVDDEDDEDEPEILNETTSGWRARQPAVVAPVTWGRPEPRKELRTNQSSTGTFRVISAHARSTTPTSIPGLHVI